MVNKYLKKQLFKKQSFKKIISVILAGALVISGIYIAPIRGGVQAGYISYEGGSICYVNASSSSYNDYYFEGDGDVIRIDYKDSYGYDKDGAYFNNAPFRIYNEANISISGGVHFTKLYTVSLNGNLPTMTVQSGGIFTIDSIESGYGGTINVNGTLNTPTIDSDFLSNNHFTVVNSGTISCDEMNLTSDISGNSSAVYNVSDSFKKSNFDMAGTVVAERPTTIESAGGSFKLKIGDRETTITEAVPAGTRAASLVFDSSEATLGSVSNVYYGQEYDFSDKIGYASGYTGTPYLEYSNDSTGTYSTDKPDYPGTYYVRAVAPDDGEFYETKSTPRSYKIEFLPLSEVDEDGAYVSVSGLISDVYAKDSFNLTSKSGYKISKWGDDDGYASTISLTKDDLFPEGNGGYLYESLYFAFMRDGDKAKTADVYIKTLVPNAEDIIFDEYDPEVNEVYIDGEETNIEDQNVFTGELLNLTITDDTALAKVDVTVNGAKTSYTPEEGMQELEFESTWGVTKDIVITATDVVGREKSFDLKLKAEPIDTTATVYIPDVTVGTDYNPVITSSHDGKADASFSYKDNNMAGTVSSTKPTEVGDYTVTATIPATDKYNELTCSSTFKIKKKTASVLSVSVPDVRMGESFEPTLTTDSNGKEDAVFEYKLAEAPENAYATVKPTLAGNYVVRATVPETAMYEKAVCTGTFSIKRYAVGIAKVEVDDVTVGTDFTPVVTTDSDGKDKVTFEYKAYDAEDSEYSATKPTAAGHYSIRATIPMTDNYEEESCTGSFNIIKKVASTAIVSIADINVGQAVSPVVETDSDGKKDATFLYKPYGADDSEYTGVVPTKAGRYEVQATIPETDTYEEVKCNGSFSISKNSVLKAVINVENIYAGQSVNPVVDTDSDGRDGVKYLYKNTGAPDSTYSSSAPINVGSYTVQAVIPETDSFVAASCTAEFEVTYLDAPDNPFSFSGTKGNNDYYITDVYLNAASGYSISGTFGGTYSSRIEYISEAQNVYLRRQSDGALTSAISVSQKLKIDKIAPEFLQGTNGSTVYSDEMSVTVKDEHLMSLTIDGDDVGVKKEEATAELDPENGEKSFKLVAEDEAGNTSSLNMTLKATWLKDKIIPANKLLPLVKSESYKLDNGKWTVSGDSTVYSGGWDVYVNSDGSYTFTKQN